MGVCARAGLVCAMCLAGLAYTVSDVTGPARTQARVRSGLPVQRLRLRGGDADVVLPAAGPPTEPGQVRRCAGCDASESEATLAWCKVTELNFCMQKSCRKDHWVSAIDWSFASRTAKPLASAGPAERATRI